MPDLYAINLHIQQRLELDWLEEVHAVKAARWLDEAGLLRNYRSGLPLRRLLRAGRIAGQDQRPDRKNGAWFIRRLAESRNPHAIRQARQRMRTYLPLERGHLHPDWPLSRDNPAFWEELGKTVAMFGSLEDTLTSACYGLTEPPADPNDLRSEHVPAHLEWYAKLEASRTNTMRIATDRFVKLLKDDGRVPHAVRHELRVQLEELRRWRNALCHGTWFGFSDAGAGVLSHFYKEDKRVVRFPPMVTLRDLAELRARIVHIIIRVAEAASVADSDSAVAAVLPRKYEPRNIPPERE